MQQRRVFDTIVIGAGSMGLATGYELSRRGQTVLMLDPYESPHTFGSHHGETRLIRIAYAEGARYVPFVQRARELWIQLEQQMRDGSHAPEALFAQIGVVSLFHPAAPSIQEIETCVREFGLDFERLTAHEAMQRWPGWDVPEDYVVHFDPAGGVLFSEACLRAYKHGCQQQGVVFKFGGGLTSLIFTEQQVEVTWGGESFTARHLVLAAGAGTPHILKSWFPDWMIPLQPIRKVFAWYQPQNAKDGPTDVYSSPGFPGFCVESPDAWFYGFPDFGEGVKVGRHDGGQPCSPETLDRTFFAGSADDQDLHQFLHAFMPAAAGPLIQGSVCMYTMTPDENFIIDRHPSYSNVIIAAGFSGHGFKFASAVGEALAEMVVEGNSHLDLSPFQTSRFGSKYLRVNSKHPTVEGNNGIG